MGLKEGLSRNGCKEVKKSVRTVAVLRQKEMVDLEVGELFAKLANHKSSHIKVALQHTIRKLQLLTISTEHLLTQYHDKPSKRALKLSKIVDDEGYVQLSPKDLNYLTKQVEVACTKYLTKGLS